PKSTRPVSGLHPEPPLPVQGGEPHFINYFNRDFKSVSGRPAEQVVAISRIEFNASLYYR
ncbi:hypothetical protein, partial [Robertkochia marina]|uniref:hypothetical protein n=1 Tax=Robertkochia marina TaxID=1227945 RepID=UPI001A7EB556